MAARSDYVSNAKTKNQLNDGAPKQCLLSESPLRDCQIMNAYVLRQVLDCIRNGRPRLVFSQIIDCLDKKLLVFIGVCKLTAIL